MRLCQNINCQNPVSGRRRYCSARCSARVRNRRYYNTLRGQEAKARGARKYFQNHREELYEKRARRFESYVQRYLGEALTDGRDFLSLSHPNCPDPTFANLVMLEARRLARIRHDWHPRQQGDSPLGRPVWKPVDPNTFVRAF